MRWRSAQGAPAPERGTHAGSNSQMAKQMQNLVSNMGLQADVLQLSLEASNAS